MQQSTIENVQQDRVNRDGMAATSEHDGAAAPDLNRIPAPKADAAPQIFHRTSSSSRWVQPTGYQRWSTRRLSLKLADHLDGTPKSAAELAPLLGTHAPSLHRYMRTLAGLGLLTEGEAQRFSLTSLGAALKTGAPGSARSSILALAAPGSQALSTTSSIPLKQVRRASRKPGACRSSTTSLAIPKMRPSSVRRWSASTARSRRLWPKPTTSPA